MNDPELTELTPTPTPNLCNDPRHDEPCPLPCQACAEECGDA